LIDLIIAFTTRETVTKFLIAAALALALTGCTAPDQALRSLKKAGFIDIEIRGHNWLRCRAAFFATDFRATAATGKVVTGTVCNSSLRKNYAEIRFD
jgi:hypothetical protein